MDLFESFSVAREALRANKLRTILTTLGVIIGVAAVIALVSVGQTVRTSVVGEFATLGPDLLWVLPGKAREGSQFAREEGRLSLTFDDAEAIARDADAVSGVSPILQTSIEVTSAGQRVTTTVVGTSPNLADVRDLTVQAGRFLTSSDLIRRKRVAALGPSLARRLYRTPSATLGRRIIINGRAFEVVGLLRSEGQVLGLDLDDRLYIPFTTAQQLFRIDYASFFFVKAQDTSAVPRALRETERILRRRHGEEDFTVLTQSQLLTSLDAILRILTVALTSIAAISLVVGGIGIMNIMLVSVTERTREIGIRKAIGARRLHILLQFLIEAVVISLVGGVLGMAVGLVLSWGITTSVFNSAPSLGSTAPIVLLAFGFSAVVGVIFGVYPAWRAAQLNPVEALRYE